MLLFPFLAVAVSEDSLLRYQTIIGLPSSMKGAFLATKPKLDACYKNLSSSVYGVEAILPTDGNFLSSFTREVPSIDKYEEAKAKFIAYLRPEDHPRLVQSMRRCVEEGRECNAIVERICGTTLPYSYPVGSVGDLVSRSSSAYLLPSPSRPSSRRLSLLGDDSSSSSSPSGGEGAAGALVASLAEKLPSVSAIVEGLQKVDYASLFSSLSEVIKARKKERRLDAFGRSFHGGGEEGKADRLIDGMEFLTREEKVAAKRMAKDAKEWSTRMWMQVYAELPLKYKLELLKDMSSEETALDLSEYIVSTKLFHNAGKSLSLSEGEKRGLLHFATQKEGAEGAAKTVAEKLSFLTQEDKEVLQKILTHFSDLTAAVGVAYLWLSNQ